jgi:EpsI family protein
VLVRGAIRLFFPGALLLLLGAYRVAFPPAEGAQSALGDLPLEILDLPGKDVPFEQAILDDLESDDMIIRRYERPDGIPVWVVAVYFVNARRGGHDPQLCYRSQGYRITTLPDLVLATGERALSAEQFLAQRTGRAERVALFWYSPGQGAVADVDRYRRELFFQGLRRNLSYGIFVRVSTLESNVEGEAEEWNRRFVARVADELPRLIRH